MDHSLVAIIRSKKDKDVTEFFKLLSLCHTVMVENKDGNPKILIWKIRKEKKPEWSWGVSTRVDCHRLRYLCYSKHALKKTHLYQIHRKVYWYKTADTELDMTWMYGFLPFSQVNWCTRLPLLMRAPWWRPRGTSATCFCLARRTPSASRRWITRQPTKCWPCSTSTRTASACLSSVRVHRHTHHHWSCCCIVVVREDQFT